MEKAEQIKEEKLTKKFKKDDDCWQTKYVEEMFECSEEEEDEEWKLLYHEDDMYNFEEVNRIESQCRHETNNSIEAHKKSRKRLKELGYNFI
ncbi:UNKNOWN [Stylonychia lemnae]|uniref:Uncharacterized protein n=1 Tax=Stylonychia lemnae TaxID=5949 RepID=A0A078B9J2_STYLE|nr:UNKNOWN [Stylonychia lemnae]|eukprot:CDW90233.1 UNKNOWN [Stylonychia lemnae]